jgi:hypothetical protein
MNRKVPAVYTGQVSGLQQLPPQAPPFRGGGVKNRRVTDPAKPLSAARQTQLHYTRKKRCKSCGARLSRTRRQPRLSSKTLCGSCAITHAEHTSASKQRLITAGLCSQCGREPLAPTSRTLGAACLRLHNQRTNQLRQERRELGLCRECGAEAGEYSRCHWCRQRQWLRRYLKLSREQRQREEEQQRQWEQRVLHWNGWDWEVRTPA